MTLEEILSEKLTNDKTAKAVESNYRGLLEVPGTERDIEQERYIKLNKLERLITPTPAVVSDKRMISENIYQLIYHCPNCGSYLRHTTHNSERQFGNGTIMKDNENPAHCPFCGQALDWSEVKE